MHRLFFYISFFSCNLSFGQYLTELQLTKNDTINGIVRKYKYKEFNETGQILLVLKSDHTYEYSLGHSSFYRYSQGNYQITNHKYIKLNSFIQKSNLPIKINYDCNDEVTDSFKITVVKNLNNEPVTDAFVHINNDSIVCLPLIEHCNNVYDSISRVKVVLENGISSIWINVKPNFRKICIVIQSRNDLKNYIAFASKKFRIKGKRIYEVSK